VGEQIDCAGNVERADQVAGIAQVAGVAAASVAAALRPSRPLSIIQIHGDRDQITPYEGGNRKSLRSRLMVRRALGPSIGVEEWAQLWTDVLGSGDLPELTELPPDITIRTWRAPTGAPSIAFYRISGGGHTWPGSRFRLPRALFGRTSTTVDATRTICEFFGLASPLDADG